MKKKIIISVILLSICIINNSGFSWDPDLGRWKKRGHRNLIWDAYYDAVNSKGADGYPMWDLNFEYWPSTTLSLMAIGFQAAAIVNAFLQNWPLASSFQLSAICIWERLGRLNFILYSQDDIEKKHASSSFIYDTGTITNWYYTVFNRIDDIEIMRGYFNYNKLLGVTFRDGEEYPDQLNINRGMGETTVHYHVNLLQNFYYNSSWGYYLNMGVVLGLITPEQAKISATSGKWKSLDVNSNWYLFFNIYGMRPLGLEFPAKEYNDKVQDYAYQSAKLQTQEYFTHRGFKAKSLIEKYVEKIGFVRVQVSMDDWAVTFDGGLPILYETIYPALSKVLEFQFGFKDLVNDKKIKPEYEKAMFQIQDATRQLLFEYGDGKDVTSELVFIFDIQKILASKPIDFNIQQSPPLYDIYDLNDILKKEEERKKYWEAMVAASHTLFHTIPGYPTNFGKYLESFLKLVNAFFSAGIFPGEIFKKAYEKWKQTGGNDVYNYIRELFKAMPISYVNEIVAIFPSLSQYVPAPAVEP